MESKARWILLLDCFTIFLNPWSLLRTKLSTGDYKLLVLNIVLWRVKDTADSTRPKRTPDLPLQNALLSPELRIWADGKSTLPLEQEITLDQSHFITLLLLSNNPKNFKKHVFQMWSLSLPLLLSVFLVWATITSR